jgi:hypothetical protein
MTVRRSISSWRAKSLLFLCPVIAFACGDDGSPDDSETGTVLQGTVTSFQPQVVGSGFALAATEGVTVAIGSKSTETDANGDYTIRNFGIGTQNVLFSRDGSMGTYVLSYVERGDSFLMDQVQFSGGSISTEHTGTWVGTGGSTDSSSVGQIAMTMVISQNGNALTGTASIADADTTVWSIDGKETGYAVTGTMDVVTTNSDCASGGEFEGTFSGNTLEGTFVEVHTAQYPRGDDCGDPESGIFNVVKQ